jgi:hypothetical protein
MSRLAAFLFIVCLGVTGCSATDDLTLSATHGLRLRSDVGIAVGHSLDLYFPEDFVDLVAVAQPVGLLTWTQSTHDVIVTCHHAGSATMNVYVHQADGGSGYWIIEIRCHDQGRI